MSTSDTDLLQRELSLMLSELESFRLEVALVPCRWETNFGGCVRVPVSQNCAWYRAFCSRHASGRFRRKSAFDTKIKRRDTVRLLLRLLSGESRSIYAEELRMVAARRVARTVAAEAAELRVSA